MNHALKLAAEFNRYFTSSNGVDVPERVSVSRDEWRRLHAAQQAEQPDSPWTENVAVKLKPSRTGRVYIAGPMTGIAEFNFPAFNSEADRLRAEGLTVLNPADHGIVEGAEWADYLRHDIAGLATCQRIHLLQGWEKSKGARLEVTIAQALGMTITLADGSVAPPAQTTQPAEVTDDLVAEALESAGVELQRFMGGVAGTKDVWTTAGSQSVRRIAAGVRAILALRPVQVPMTDERSVSVKVDRELFSFHSEQDWVNKARSRYANCGVQKGHYITVDAAGHVMHMGLCFKHAAYPVTVYQLQTNWPKEQA